MQERSNAPPDGWRPAGHCAIFVCDIVSYGNLARHQGIQRHLRKTLYGLLRKCFDVSGAPFDTCYWEDRGDGAIVVVPSEIDTAVLVSPLVDWLRSELRQYNEVSSEVAQIRLRVSLHVGEVHTDDVGLIGTAVNHVNRLLEAPRFKDALSASPAFLGLIVSEEVHGTVIRTGAGLPDPGDYAPVRVQVKETETIAWMRIFGDGPAEPPLSQELESAKADVTRQAWAAHLKGTAQEEPPPFEPFDLIEIAERLLAVPLMGTSEGRQQVVSYLRREVAVRIPRSSQANLDAHSIVRTCLDFPDGLEELLAVIRTFAGDSVQMRALEETITRLITRRN
jgi:hypothetical protein